MQSIIALLSFFVAMTFADASAIGNAYPGKGCLKSFNGYYLPEDYSACSKNGKFRLLMQRDGNLVLFNHETKKLSAEGQPEKRQGKKTLYLLRK